MSYILRSLLPGLLGLFFVTACSSDYHDLKAAFSDKQYSDYYYEEVSRVDGILPQPDDSFLKEIDANVSANLEHWKTTLDRNTDSGGLVDVDSSEVKRVSHLSTSDLQSDISKQLDLQTAIAIAITRNPRIQMAEANLKASLERFPQAVNLDTILSQYNAFTRELNTITGPNDHKSMVKMSFPTPGMTELKGQVIDQDVMVAMKQLEIAKRDIVAQVKSTFFEYLYQQNAISISTETQKLLEELIKVAQVKYKSDSAKYVNLVLAQVELAKVSNSLITLKQKQSTAMARLNMLMNLPTETALGVPTVPELLLIDASPDEVWEVALARRQEIQIRRAALKRTELMVAMASKMTYPDLTAGNSYFEDRAGPASTQKPGGSFMANRTIDQRTASDLGRRDAYIREMRAATDSMQRRLTDQINQSNYDTRKALYELDSSLRSLKLHREVLIPQATQALKASKTGYTAGKVDFIGYLDAQRSLLQLRLSEAEAFKTYQTSLATLDQFSGTVLRRKPFTSQPKTP